ncbi:YdcF family protein [Hazenella sp. IB182357]|uniref:YdcF family protein n=1 Tax=Polycladospora coralii TaxID=2771432 RepID=A0A926NC66_9BACL|nr:YdcF family protein [Polycladospora coralii]MBD1372695.1 YdcF family protein [Polycladospora coralii]MBS7531089.1 YdcF family protein [Polycladospora coralii]
MTIKWYWILLIFSLIAAIPFIIYWPSASQFDARNPDGETRQAAIILGAALWDKKPSPALKERCDLAYQLYKEKKVSHLVLSGGLGNNGITEAQGMRDYLLEKGVKEEDLLLEEHSSNTKQNLKYTASLLSEHKLDRVYLVTHDYHMNRALTYASQAGIKAAPAPVHSTVLFMPYHKARECLAWVKLNLLKK